MSIASTGKSIKFMWRFFDPKWKRVKPIKNTNYKAAKPITPAVSPLPTATPESVGVESGYIESFLREIGKYEDIRLHGIIIARNGRTICKASYGAQNIDVPKYTFSACKSIISLGIGFLMDDGLVKPDDRICDLLDRDCPTLSRIRLRQTTLEQVLTMQSSITFSELDSITQENWLGGIMESPMYTDLSRTFRYNSLNTYLLAAIICKVTGMSVTEFLAKRLFEPLSITDYYWETCPRGIEKGGWGLYIRPEDMAKIGTLVMNGGEYNGKSILSGAYLDYATTPYAVSPDSFGNFNYGCQIWVGRKSRSFLFNGMFDQNVLGFRDSGIVIVTNSGDEYNFQQSGFFDIASRYFDTRFYEKLPENKKAFKKLNAYIETLSAYTKPKRPLREASFAPFKGISCHTEEKNAVSVGLMPNMLQLVQNNYTSGVKSITVSDRSDIVEMIYTENDTENRFIVGIEKPEITVLTFGNQAFLAAVSGKVTKDEDDNPVLKVTVDYLETPFTRTIKLILKGKNVLLRQSESPGRDYIFNLMCDAADISQMPSIVSDAIENLDMDFIAYKVDKTFSPEVKMTRE